jgi:hypothetical protein|tara:strand:- start:11371 stop:12513 length:1143 start_codon:yes stop_codon:yes gene_type:complete
MAKQTINIGTTANDGTGSSLRAGGDLVNDNFNEIYTELGNGTTLAIISKTQTLSNKTIDLGTNTVTGSLAEFNTALQSDTFTTAASTTTFTNKTIDLGDNTATGSLAEFNTALQGDSFVSLTGSETLTNKTLTSPEINTITRTGDFTLDVSGDLTLDSDGATIAFKDGGTIFGAVINNSGEMQLRSGASLGTAMTFAGANTTANGDLTVTGTLTVNGSTTTVNSTNTTVDDNLLELNSGATSNANDTGIIMERGSTGDNAIVAWDESADKFVMGTTTATASDTGNLTIATGTLVANIEGNVTGALTGNADTATALATGRTIGMSGDVVWTSASFDGSGNVTGVAALQANTVSSTELVGATTLLIINSADVTQKTIIGAGS